jgi:hypothetical protein
VSISIASPCVLIEHYKAHFTPNNALDGTVTGSVCFVGLVVTVSLVLLYNIRTAAVECVVADP